MVLVSANVIIPRKDNKWQDLKKIPEVCVHKKYIFKNAKLDLILYVFIWF